MDANEAKQTIYLLRSKVKVCNDYVIKYLENSSWNKEEFLDEYKSILEFIQDILCDKMVPDIVIKTAMETKRQISTTLSDIANIKTIKEEKCLKQL